MMMIDDDGGGDDDDDDDDSCTDSLGKYNEWVEIGRKNSKNTKDSTAGIGQN